MKTVYVRFENSRYSTEYSYLYSGTDSVTKDDYVVVEGTYSDLKYTLAKVTRVADGCGPKATKQVIQVVDMTEARAREEAAKKRACILKKLAEKEKKVSEAMKYEYLASIDEEAAALLTELKGLSA